MFELRFPVFHTGPTDQIDAIPTARSAEVAASYMWKQEILKSQKSILFGLALTGWGWTKETLPLRLGQGQT